MKFTSDTTAIFYNLKALPIQQMLDFDYVCQRTPSVAAIVHPGRKGFHKCFLGAEEILIPIYDSLSEAMRMHPVAEVWVNFASFRSAVLPSKEALLSPTIKTVAIVAEGIPERDSKEMIALAERHDKLIGGPVYGRRHRRRKIPYRRLRRRKHKQYPQRKIVSSRKRRPGL